MAAGESVEPLQAEKVNKKAVEKTMNHELSPITITG